MTASIKFCGITRTSDASHAAKLGARFVGAILTDSPRRVSPATARQIYAAAGSEIRGVAVFRNERIEDVVALGRDAGAQVLQIHRQWTATELARLKTEFAGEIWTVVDAEPGSEGKAPLPDEDTLADGVLIDSAVNGKSGGTGKPLQWEYLTQLAAAVRRGRQLILAGGLTPSNVADAIDALAPDVVDVSSGIESAPGIKDLSAMESFARAVSGR